MQKKNELQKQSIGSTILDVAQPIMQIGLSGITPLLLYYDPGIGSFSLAAAGAVSSTISNVTPTIFDAIKQKRLELGIKKVNEHKIPLEKFLKNNKSVSNLAAALECISNTARDEKIEYITNLVCNSALNDSISEENDVFEMKLNLLDEVTYDEIDILESLQRNYKPIPADPGKHPKEFYNAIKQTLEDISKDIDISLEFVRHRLDKLHGIGLCGKDVMLEATFGICNASVHYYPSPLYSELRDYILKVHKSKGK